MDMSLDSDFRIPVFMMTVNAEEIYNCEYKNQEKNSVENSDRSYMTEEDYYYYYHKRLTKADYQKKIKYRHLYPATSLPNSMDSIYLRNLISRDDECYHMSTHSFEQTVARQHMSEKESSNESEELQYLKTNVILSVDFSRDCNKEGHEKTVAMETIRKKLYESGFHMNCHMKNHEIRLCHFVPYKRSSSAVKEGRHLFIMDHFENEMKKWTWLGLDIDFQDLKKFDDLASIKAYESLVNSSIRFEEVVVKPEQILLVDDIIREFQTKAKVIRYKNQGIGIEQQEAFKTETNLFDGQSLMDTTIFDGHVLKDGKKTPGMMLLRNHFFKTCAFHTDIQKFMRENYLNEDGTPCEKIKDMFGRELSTADIRLITTPSSLKVLKLAPFLYPYIKAAKGLTEEAVDESEKKKVVYEYWLSYIGSSIGDNSIFKDKFGVVKYESISNWGAYQRLSYQMLNSLPFDEEDIERLLTNEFNYMKLMHSNLRDLSIADQLETLLTRADALEFWTEAHGYTSEQSLEEKKDCLLESFNLLKQNPYLKELLKEIQSLKQSEFVKKGSFDQVNYGVALEKVSYAEKCMKQITNSTSVLSRNITKRKMDPDLALDEIGDNFADAFDALRDTIYLLRMRHDYNTQVFLRHIKGAKASISVDLIKDLLYYSLDFQKTSLFREYRRDVFKAYKDTLYMAKLKVPGDYYVLCSMPVEMLFHAIGLFDGKKKKILNGQYKNKELPILGEGEVYNCLLRKGGKKSAAIFRNPHICASNVILVNQRDDYPVNRYFNFGDHIIVVSPWESTILRRLGGADFDSDTVLCTTDETIIKRAKEVQGFPVVYNTLLDDLQKLHVKANLEDTESVKEDSMKAESEKGDSEDTPNMYAKALTELDHKLSRNLIGTIVNLSQILNCYFWNAYYAEKANHKDGVVPSEWIRNNRIYNDILTLEALTEVEIDKAKHSEYMQIDMNQIIRSIRLRKDEEGSFVIRTEKVWLNPIKKKDNKAKKKKEELKEITIYPAFTKYIMPKKLKYMERIALETQKAALERTMAEIECPLNYLMNRLDQFRLTHEPKNTLISMDQFFDIKQEDTEHVSEGMEKLKEIVGKNALFLKTNRPDLVVANSETEKSEKDTTSEEPDVSGDQDEDNSMPLVLAQTTSQIRSSIIEEAKSLNLSKEDVRKCIALVYLGNDKKQKVDSDKKTKDEWKKNRILILSVLYSAYPEEFKSCLTDKRDVIRGQMREITNHDSIYEHLTGQDNSVDYEHDYVNIWGRYYTKA